MQAVASLARCSGRAHQSTESSALRSSETLRRKVGTKDEGRRLSITAGSGHKQAQRTQCPFA
eukprot:gene8057-1289_t